MPEEETNITPKNLRFTMPFQPMAIDHLGLRLYSQLPPVINEFVTNAYDAESPKVEIVLPHGAIQPNSEIVIRDFGHGMNAIELQNEFLPIGRNRRGIDSSNVMSRTGLRRVTGRKGLGKLSGLGVANEMQIRSIQNGTSICLKLNYDDMKEWSKSHVGEYEPAVVYELTGSCDLPNGLEIRLRQLRRKSAIQADEVRKGIARRVRLIDPNFVVIVDGVPVGVNDHVDRSETNLSWSLDETESGDTLPNGERLSGWIGFLHKSSKTGRGIDVFSSGKAVELESFFNFSSSHAQFARAYLVGEVHADCLDAIGEDLTSTARNSVVWESETGRLLEKWGQDTLRWAFGEWINGQRKAREDTVIRAGNMEAWLAGRTESERRAARKIFAVVAGNEDLEPSAIEPLMEIVKSSIETMAFRTLIEAMDDKGITVPALIKLFQEWRVIEAREHLMLADGRLSAIEKLSNFMASGALEVQEMEPLLFENLWMVDPSWSTAYVQQTYTKMIQKFATEPKDTKPEDRRLDIVGVSDDRRISIVEIKRPNKAANYDDLVQIERYVLWARDEFGSGSSADSIKWIDGILIVGSVVKSGPCMRKVENLVSQDIRVLTYDEMHRRAGEYFRQVEQRLKKEAPEYARSHRKKALEILAGANTLTPEKSARTKGSKKRNSKRGRK